MLARNRSRLPLRKKKRFWGVTVISGARIPLALCFLYFFTGRETESRLISLYLLSLLLTTDCIDGVLARKWGVTSKFGYVLDGVADRASYLACLLGISQESYFPLLLLYPILLRDLFLYGSRSVFAGWYEVAESSRWPSKVNALSLRIFLALALGLFYWRSFRAKAQIPYRSSIEEVIVFLAVAYTIMAYILLVRQVRRYLSSTSLLGSSRPFLKESKHERE
jgi:cardiolipin synthase